MSGRRVAGAGAWLDRARPVAFTFDGRAVQGFAGDTVASALLASGEVGGFVSPIVRRPRGVYAAGVEEPNAFVEIAEPWFEPIRPATMVNVVDGLQTTSRAGVGVLPTSPVAARPARHTRRHVETLVIGGGAAGRAAATIAQGRVLIVDEQPVVMDPPPNAITITSTTATGIYDDGYVLCYQRDGATDVFHHVRARH